MKKLTPYALIPLIGLVCLLYNLVMDTPGDGFAADDDKKKATRSEIYSPRATAVPQPAGVATPAPKAQTLQKSALLNVPAQSQMPELYNGCEITSLSMLLAAAGHPADKTVLADKIAKDPTPMVNENGDIIAWGDPNAGFVGDITGDEPGYGVYHGPVARLLNGVLPGRAKDLTGKAFEQILLQVESGKPVVAWTTAAFSPTSDWENWQGPNGKVRATFKEHAVLIVGFDDDEIVINDPLDGAKAKRVDRDGFTAAWEQMGKQAVSFS
jgi:uncharacterized protein YvpB